jgi:hypothetical protein
MWWLLVSIADLQHFTLYIILDSNLHLSRNYETALLDIIAKIPAAQESIIQYIGINARGKIFAYDNRNNN